MTRGKTLFIGAISIAFVLAAAGSVRAQEDNRQLLKQLEEDTDRFTKTLDSGLDNSALNGTATEDEINEYVHRFEEATDRLKSNYENGQDTKFAAQEVLQRGRAINSFLRKHKLNNAIQTDWATVKLDLGRLARANKVKVVW